MPQISNQVQSVIDSRISIALGELTHHRRRARQRIELNKHQMVVVNRVIAEVMLRSRTLWRRVNENLSRIPNRFCEGSLWEIAEKTNILSFYNCFKHVLADELRISTFLTNIKNAILNLERITWPTSLHWTTKQTRVGCIVTSLKEDAPSPKEGHL